MEVVTEIGRKSGKTYYLPKLSDQDFMLVMDGNEGFCIMCGSEAYGVEPDARKYTCESCGQKAVYGYQELVMMGMTR